MSRTSTGILKSRFPGIAASIMAIFMSAYSIPQLAYADTAPPASNNAPCISWVNPLIRPRVALLCVHGLGLYSGSYQDFGTRASKRGVAVYAIDVRGFGSWMKAEGHQQIDFNSC